jgi:hypothetical protein
VTVAGSAVRGGRRLHVGEESETHEWTHWGTGVSSLSDAERDACDVVQALAGLAALLARPTGGPADPELDDARRTLLSLAQDGNTAAVRVLAYLRVLRGAGDGDAVAVPSRLGPWRDWVPPRGHVFGYAAEQPRIGEMHHRHRTDPGE